MSLFDEALAAARGAVADTYGRPMTITPMLPAKFKGGTVDPARPAFDAVGILHEFAIGGRGEPALIERSDGGRPGRAFGVDLAGAPTRISFDLGDLAGRVPVAADRITLGDGRVFEISHAAPPNGGRQSFFVAEVAS